MEYYLSNQDLGPSSMATQKQCLTEYWAELSTHFAERSDWIHVIPLSASTRLPPQIVNVDGRLMRPTQAMPASTVCGHLAQSGPAHPYSTTPFATELTPTLFYAPESDVGDRVYPELRCSIPFGYEIQPGSFTPVFSSVSEYDLQRASTVKSRFHLSDDVGAVHHWERDEPYFLLFRLSKPFVSLLWLSSTARMVNKGSGLSPVYWMVKIYDVV